MSKKISFTFTFLTMLFALDAIYAMQKHDTAYAFIDIVLASIFACCILKEPKLDVK